MNDKDFRYKDILYRERPVSPARAHMTDENRAAQFMPFAALTGFGAMINETSRLTTKKHQLNEDELTLLNENLNKIAENISSKPEVKLVYFIPDERKSGGKYVSFQGSVRRLDEFKKELIFTDKSVVKIEDVLLIELL
jgi:hypothetical protein